VAFGNDADADRHGIVTPTAGLLKPEPLPGRGDRLPVRPPPRLARGRGRGQDARLELDDRPRGEGPRPPAGRGAGRLQVVRGRPRGRLVRVRRRGERGGVVPAEGRHGLDDDKDGILLDLLACEIRAVTGKDPGQLYRELEARFGSPAYERIDAPATREQKAALGRLSPEAVKADTLAGEPIVARLTKAPANDAPIGAAQGRHRERLVRGAPLGTEDVYKLYAESFKGRDHLKRIQDEAGRSSRRAVGLSYRSRRIRTAPRKTTAEIVVRSRVGYRGAAPRHERARRDHPEVGEHVVGGADVGGLHVRAALPVPATSHKLVTLAASARAEVAIIRGGAGSERRGPGGAPP